MELPEKRFDAERPRRETRWCRAQELVESSDGLRLIPARDKELRANHRGLDRARALQRLVRFSSPSKGLRRITRRAMSS
jgi:hypothetical protein